MSSYYPPYGSAATEKEQRNEIDGIAETINAVAKVEAEQRNATRQFPATSPQATELKTANELYTAFTVSLYPQSNHWCSTDGLCRPGLPLGQDPRGEEHVRSRGTIFRLPRQKSVRFRNPEKRTVHGVNLTIEIWRWFCRLTLRRKRAKSFATVLEVGEKWPGWYFKSGN